MLYEKLDESLAFIRTKTAFRPRIGIVLGTGLGDLASEIKVQYEIAYQDIPHFPLSTVKGHKNKLIFGTIGDCPVVAMAGRFHYYEGYSLQEVTFPIRVLKLLGIERLILSNASGSTNSQMEAGDIVFVKDHINLLPGNPLRGQNDERLGPRFPDMLHTYDKEMLQLAQEVAIANDIKTHLGVYVALQGPNLETPAEYNYLHRIGGDLVGMSTVPEVIVARHSDIPVFVVSVVSNKCYPVEEIQVTTIDSVIAKVKETAPKIRLIVKEMLQRL